jgi:phage terminase large subunit-like protein
MRRKKLAKDNYIFAYYQQIKAGKVCVGRWITLLYELLITGLEEKRFFFDQAKADAAIDWIEAHCFHTEGRLAPGPLKLELWQKAFLSAIFGIIDKDGERQWREVLLVISRKNGKSKLGAAIAEYIWREAGGYGARVFCIAPKLEQADIVYNDIWQMTQLDPEWQELKEIVGEKNMHNKRVNDDSMLARHRMTDLCVPGTNSTVKKIAFSAKKSDGFNPSLCVCDEVAAWEGDKGLKQYEVMKSGMGARPDGLLLSCTTSGYINDGIYDELVKRSTRFLMGDSKETKLLPFLYMIDDPDKWNDINELRKSNPNLGVSVSVDYLLEEIAVAEGSLSKKAEFITKYCCLKQTASTAWLSTQDVDKCCGKPLRLEDFRNSYAVGGIDLSQTRDLTACCVVIERGGELYVFAQFFLPRERIDEAIQRDGVPYNLFVQRGLLTLSGDQFVDYHDCETWFRQLVEEYQIYPLQTGFDRYSASYLVQSMETYGFKMDSVYQGENLWPVLQEMGGLIAEGRVHIGDNDLLKSHLLNAAIKMSNERGRGKLVKVNPSLHIDGCAALADAFTVRQKWAAEIGEQLKNEG